MIVKPDGREVVCHASAWDFYNQKDFRYCLSVLSFQRFHDIMDNEMNINNKIYCGFYQWIFLMNVHIQYSQHK